MHSREKTHLAIDKEIDFEICGVGGPNTHPVWNMGGIREGGLGWGRDMGPPGGAEPGRGWHGSAEVKEGRAKRLSRFRGTQQEGLSLPLGRCDIIRDLLLAQSHYPAEHGSAPQTLLCPQSIWKLRQNAASDSVGVFAHSAAITKYRQLGA